MNTNEDESDISVDVETSTVTTHLEKKLNTTDSERIKLHMDSKNDNDASDNCLTTMESRVENASTSPNSENNDGKQQRLRRKKRRTRVVFRPDVDWKPNARKLNGAVGKRGRRALCARCNELFDTREERDLHYEEMHPGLLPYPCPRCPRAFLSRTAQSMHIQSVHEGKRPFPCRFCSRNFTTLMIAGQHELRMHGGDAAKRFACDRCPKRYCTEFELRNHSRSHENGPFECDRCKLVFSSVRAYERHMAMHEEGYDFLDFQCEECDKMFPDPAQLAQHRLRHSERRHFLCEQCGSAFKTKGALKQHLTLHAPHVMKYECSICFLRFPRRSQCEEHIETHRQQNNFKNDETMQKLQEMRDDNLFIRMREAEENRDLVEMAELEDELVKQLQKLKAAGYFKYIPKVVEVLEPKSFAAIHGYSGRRRGRPPYSCLPYGTGLFINKHGNSKTTAGSSSVALNLDLEETWDLDESLDFSYEIAPNQPIPNDQAVLFESCTEKLTNEGQCGSSALSATVN